METESRLCLYKGEKSPGPFNFLFKVLCMNHLFILGTFSSSVIKPRIGPGQIMRSQISVPLNRSHVSACRNSVFSEHRARSHSATLESPALLWVTLSDSQPSLCRHPFPFCSEPAHLAPVQGPCKLRRRALGSGGPMHTLLE